MPLYHFTSPYHLPVILDAGFLKLTDPNLSEAPNSGPGVVWLLDTPEALGGPGDHEMYNGLYPMKTLVRFQVNVPGIKWSNWAPAANMDREWRAAITKVGGFEHWYVWPTEIPASKWVEISVREESGWVSHPLHETS